MTDEILTLKEVATYLKLAEKTSYKLAAEAKLPGFSIGGSWRFQEKDIDCWEEEKNKPKVLFVPTMKKLTKFRLSKQIKSK